jgi:hypothetical protein
VLIGAADALELDVRPLGTVLRQGERIGRLASRSGAPGG